MGDTYAVVRPVGAALARVDLAVAPPSSTGRLGLVSNYVSQTGTVFDVLAEELSAGRKAADATARPEDFGNLSGRDEQTVVHGLPERARELGVEGLLVGVGASGSCTPAVIRACASVVRSGRAALPIIATGYVPQAVAAARALGVEGLAYAEYPGLPMNESAEEVADKVRRAVLPDVRQWLDGTLGKHLTDVAGAPEVDGSDRRSIALTGSLDEVQDRFETEGWSDGLPVIPPTIERVETFLQRTPLPAEHVIGVLPPGMREVTVWDVAVNAVMAGCRPEYLPILIAATEAIADPHFKLEDAGSTPGWEPLVIVSGPAVADLGFNVGTGVMRVGRRSNSTIGRFLRLVLCNLAGLRIPPGELDRGSIGATFNVALGEDEAAARELGWPTFGEDRGASAGESTVTVQSVVAISPPIYCGGTEPEAILEMLVEIMRHACGPWSFSGVWYEQWHPLIVMSPNVAGRLAAAGWDKDKVRAHLFDHVRLEAHWLDRYPMHAAGATTTLAELVGRGEIPALYAESDDPERLVPLLVRPEWTGIVLAGDPERNQARVYVNNHQQGPPVTRAAAFT